MTQTPIKWHVRPVKTSLIRVVSVHSVGSYVNKLSSCGQRKLLSDCALLNLRWAHMPFSIFCHALAQLYLESHITCTRTINIDYPSNERAFLFSTVVFGSRKAKRCLRACANVRIHIIERMRKVSSGTLLSIHTFCSVQFIHFVVSNDSVSGQ